MPSMHLGVVAVYILGARGTRWLLPAIGMWIIIFISSGYFGYHYWVDGIAAAAVAAGCWAGAERLYVRSAGTTATLLEVGEPRPLPSL